MAVRLYDLALSLSDLDAFHLVEHDALTQAMLSATEPEKAGNIEFGHGRTLVAVSSAVAQNIFQQWIANARGVAGPAGSEYVHQMRIALRRMRTAYRIFDKALREASIEPDERELKWIGGLLGDLRDWDVLLEGTFPTLAEAAASSEDDVPAEDSGKDAHDDPVYGDSHVHDWTQARAEVVKRREVVADTLRAALNSTRYATLVMRTGRQVAMLTAAAADRRAMPLNPFGRKTLRKRYKRLMSAKNIDRLPAQDRHKLRIHAKRLRYAIEFLAPALDRKTRKRMAQRMSDLQDTLGVANDAVVARQFLASLNLPPLVKAFANGYLSAREASAVSGGAEQFEKLRKKKE
jgi:CHAD domain-containing protein